ncbi:MAG TPA: hypothetical protein PLG73_13410, partial [Candidatus Sumerlaeota bacterium]|nr:hypothetical protein [Candidatus Sumerlaeota bacterium]
TYYPELRPLLLADPPPGADTCDVLLLGGSVLFEYYGGPALHLEAALEQRLHRPVRVWNLGRPSHASRDSLIKYRWLDSLRFDAVVVYHAINELRTNHAPADRFRLDYDHVPWYREVNALAGHPAGGFSRACALPLLVRYAPLWLERQLRPRGPLAPDAMPGPEDLIHGDDIKSTASLAANLSEIAAIARRRGDPLLLLTYAWWLPDGYSDEDLLHDRELAIARAEARPPTVDGPRRLPFADPLYADFAQPVSIWGRREQLVKGLSLHNEVIRAVARDHAIPLVDLAARMGDSGDYFIDICHLSPAGVARLVDGILDGLTLLSFPAAPGDPARQPAHST